VSPSSLYIPKAVQVFTLYSRNAAWNEVVSRKQNVGSENGADGHEIADTSDQTREGSIMQHREATEGCGICEDRKRPNK
jgi:hypothetical protein